MKKLLPEKLLAIIVAAFLLPISQAQAESDNINWYTVEVISFTRAKTAQVQERWPTTSAEAGSGSAVFTPLDIQSVASSERQLGNHAYAINRSSGLSVKSHQIWRQKGLPREEAPWITLETGSPALSGKIRISLSRYLHADLDIQLPNPDWSPSYSTAETISFNASRKLKRGKLHYIDHPLAGVLLLIERFEKGNTQPESEEMDTQNSQSANQKSTT